ncbi:hypothetical protein ACWGRF_21225 [Streptomyces zhihengii]
MSASNDVSGHGRPHGLVRDVVRAVVAGVAPDELPVVDGLRRFDDATVARRLGGSGERREPLGFGAGEIVLLVTPVVWPVLHELGQRLVTRTADAAERGAGSVFRRLFRRPQAPVEIPPLTREQMAEVRLLVLAAAEKRRLSRRRAEEIADAVVAELALADPSEPAPEPGPGAAPGSGAPPAVGGSGGGRG